MPLSPATRLSPLDLALVAIYLVAITIFGLRFAKFGGRRGKQSGSLKSYFLADNTIPWWAIALSIVSAETSTLTIISIPGVAFAGDMGFLQVVLGYMLGRIVVAALFLPKYFRGEMLTAYQLIDQRFGPVLHKVTAGLFLLTRAAAEGVRVFAISIVVSIAIGTGDTVSIAIISALTLLYTFEGGMAAVIWTDVVQMALYVAGTLVALYTLGAHIPGGWSYIHASAAPLGKFHMLNFALNLTQSYTFWAGVLGGTFLTMASHGTDQLMVQRMLAARNLRESRLALLSSGVVIFFQFTIFLLIGIGLFVFYGTHPQVFASPDRIFPTFIVQQMPHGVAGLLVAAILAAAMSNLSAALNSLSSTTVVDFYMGLRPLADERERSFVSRASTIFWAVVLFLIAVYSIQVGGKGHVVETGLSIASVAYGCLLGVFLLGTLTPRSSKYSATQWGATLGMVCGFVLNLWLWQGSFPKQIGPLMIPHIAFTWYVLIGSLATFALGSLFSLILPKPRRMAVSTRVVSTLVLFAVILSAAKDPRIASAQAPTQSPDFTAVSTLINTAIAEKKLPGAVVLIGHNGKVVFEQAYGVRKLAGEPGVSLASDGKPDTRPEPMTEDTIFDMASLTKVLVTTTAVLQLYEQGKLDLDAPVARYLPDFASVSLPDATVPAPASLGTDHDPVAIIPSQHRAPESAAKDGTVIPAASGRNLGISSSANAVYKSRITIRQLLTHYSGLPEDVNLKDDWGLKAPDKAEGIRRAMASVPYGPPGQTFKYSDINFITLGALVEKIMNPQWGLFADRPTLDLYAALNILKPLGVKETRFLSFDKVCGPLQQMPIPWRSPFMSLPVAGVSGFEVDCDQMSWTAVNWIERTAPTAHDNEGTALSNPDFDHLLRGTVHDPTTRRMGGVAGHAGVFSTAADMSKFCQALLDKLLHNTGPFPLSQATLRLATSPQAPPTAVKTATIFTPDGKTSTGVAQRGLGWDINSPYSRPRGEIFPIATSEHPGSFGHTGFTGTSIWIDPTSDTYVILLSNAIHPRGAPPISTLRGQVATAAAKALLLSSRSAAEGPASQTPGAGAPSFAPVSYAKGGVSSEARPPSSTPADHLDPEMLESGIERVSYPSTTGQSVSTLTGIDVLESTDFAALKAFSTKLGRPLKLGLLTNQSGIDSHSIRTIDILFAAGKTNKEFALTTLFTPEHGLSAQQDTEHLRQESDSATHLPVISLYGPKASDKHPRQADLRKLDAVVIDLQDAGVRFWTYETILGYFLEDCARAHVEVIVLDRPNPIGGVAVQGPSSDLGFESYIDFMSIPVRHGMTFGELARFFNDNATQVQLKPELLDGQALHLGNDTGADAGGISEKPPATQPGLHASLTVIPMQHWQRAEYFADTQLPWVPPSPNMKTPATGIPYPGVALIETTNMSVGRGTPAPYENFGAPFVKATGLAAYLNARNIPGITFSATTMAIAEDANHYPFHGQTISAIHLAVTNRALLDSPEMGVEILSALHHLYPAQFQLEKAHTILLNAATLEAVKAGKDPRDIAASWAASLAAFKSQRLHYLLYQ